MVEAGGFEDSRKGVLTFALVAVILYFIIIIILGSFVTLGW